MKKTYRAEELKSGDILVVSSESIPVAIHYAMFFRKDGEPYVTHCSLTLKYVWLTGDIEIEPYEKFIKGRKIYKVIHHPNLTDRDVYQKALDLQKIRKYDMLYYSCEDYMHELCNGCKLGLDQRLILYGAIFFIIILTAFIFYRLTHKK